LLAEAMMTVQIDIAAAAGRFEFLDDLGSYLAMPGAASEWPHGMRPLHEMYGSTPTGEDDPGAPYIVRLARRLYGFMDADKAFQSESLKRLVRMIHRTRLPAGLGNIGGDIWSGIVQERAMVYDLAIALNSGLDARKLIEAARFGDEEALLKLVKVDKSILGAPWAVAILEERQCEGDWAFFKRLGYAVRRDPIDKGAGYAREVLVVALFWQEHFRHCSLEQTVEMLRPHFPVFEGASDYDSFRKQLNRAGLKKPLHNRKVGQISKHRAS
jgi:hypothetical protein